MTNNTTSPATATRIADVRSIGAGIRKSDTTTAAIVAAVPEGFDAKVRGAVTEFVSRWINGDADAPAQKIGAKGEQTMTDYGRGFEALVKSVKRALATPPAKTEKLTVTYVNADGESRTVTIAPTAEMFADLTSGLFGEADSE